MEGVMNNFQNRVVDGNELPKRSVPNPSVPQTGPAEPRTALATASPAASAPVMPTSHGLTATVFSERHSRLIEAVKTIIECVGEDPDRKGLVDTPERYANAMLFFTRGYSQDLKTIVNGAIFGEDHDEMVVVKDIAFPSLCEHHLVPFIGKVHVGYIPNGNVIGLSKISRVVEMYARRLSIQERLTKQIADAVMEVTNPMGVAVLVEAKHMCMAMRGVEQIGASTTTSSMLGCFRDNAKTRGEFFHAIGRC